MTNDGGAAFPLDPLWVINPGTRKLVPADEAKGMSLRDYFAAQVIGMAAHDLTDPPDIARRAYAVADAMLTARKA